MQIYRPHNAFIKQNHLRARKKKKKKTSKNMRKAAKIFLQNF